MVDYSLGMDVPTLFASNLHTFSNNAITDLQYAGLTRDEPLSREALQVAAGLFDMWDQRPEKLQDEDWTEEAAVMEAGQELWTMWSLKEWAQEAPYYKFFSVYPKAMVPGRRSVALADINMTDMLEMPLFEEDNKDFETSPVQNSYAWGKGRRQQFWAELMGIGPSNTRPTKILKTGSSQPSTKQAKAMVDILAAHVTDKDLVDEGLEGDIAVKKKVGVPAAQAVRAPANDKEGPAVGPSNTTPAALPTLGAEDEVLGEPKLEEEDVGAPVAPEVAERDGRSESTRSVWRPTDEPATKFEWVTWRVGELQEMEVAVTAYADACKRECADLRFALLRSQTMLGEAQRQQGVLAEARREAEEALWDISAFE
ncbi:hypothetical protein C0991_005754 [Blastosporella zonata]|nr:hypothetical protein C0991_005754 [Blastosporella zonata]